MSAMGYIGGGREERIQFQSLILYLPLSYRPAPASSPSTEADVQPTATPEPTSPDDTLDTSTREPPVPTGEDEDSEAEEDISDATSPRCEKQRPMSWPGSLPRRHHHHLKFPSRPAEQVIFNQVPLRTQTTTTSSSSSPISTVTAPAAAVISPPRPSLSSTPAVPLWAVSGSSAALRPMSVSSTTSSSFTSSPSVIYNMLGPQSLSSQPLLTPLLTIVPSTALVSTAAAAIAAKPAKASPPPLILSPQARPSNLPALTRPLTAAASAAILPPQAQTAGIVNRRQVVSPAGNIQAEPATGQTIVSPVSKPLASPKVISGVPAQRTLASIPPSEMTPQYVELKAFAEEFKTKRIRLGYTQGSVGQSLARKGYSNFAQSTISRFEQMQLSATNAAAIKQVLEKWLQETEFPESVASNSSDVPMMASRKRKKRAVFTPQTKSTLDEFFRQNPRPNRQAIESIAQQLDLLPEEVRVWFCNKRQKQKQSSTSSISSYYSAASPSSSSSSGGFLAIRSPSLSPKQRSPSPKTSFTIEELSKSSSNGGHSSSPSPVLLTSPFSISPSALSISATGGGVFPLIMPTTTLPNMPITQTQA